MKKGIVTFSVLAFLLCSCTDKEAEERLPAAVNVSLRATEKYDTRTSEILLFDADGYFESRYTDQITGNGIRLNTKSGTHYILVFINTEDYTIIPQVFKPGQTHYREVAATARAGDNPYLWFGNCTRQLKSGSSDIEIMLEKASSVIGLTVNGWTHRETEVDI